MSKICLQNIIIERVSQVKYLGLHIDEKQNWNVHINKLKNKIRPVVFAVSRLRQYLNTRAVWNIYYAYIVSH